MADASNWTYVHVASSVIRRGIRYDSFVSILDAKQYFGIVLDRNFRIYCHSQFNNNAGVDDVEIKSPLEEERLQT